jgi:hypothetical protein
VDTTVGNSFTPLTLSQFYEILAQQLGVKNYSTEFHDNPTAGLVAYFRYILQAETES